MTIKAKSMKLVFFLFTNMMLSCVFSQNNTDNQTNIVYLEIKETNYETTKQRTFEFSKNKLSIYEISISKKGTEKKKLYSKRLTNSEVVNLESKLEQLDDLNSEYINPALGGIYWEIYFVNRNVNKTIIIENMKIDAIDSLFDFINTIIKNNKLQLIRLN